MEKITQPKTNRPRRNNTKNNRCESREEIAAMRQKKIIPSKMPSKKSYALKGDIERKYSQNLLFHSTKQIQRH